MTKGNAHKEEMPQIRILISKPVEEFLQRMPDKARNKMIEIFQRVKRHELNSEIFKKLKNSNIWEFRMEFSKIAYRIFAFWDNESQALIVSTHGLVKKTQETPRSEIERAENIRKAYFDNKHHKK